ncbi:MAG TPA: hypothetical protein V6C89_21890 [Drouetiella sp.]
MQNDVPIQKTTWKAQCLWLLVWCASLFVIGGFGSSLGEEQDYLRWVRPEQPYKQSDADALKRDAFLLGGAIFVPIGIVGWAICFGISKQLQKRKTKATPLEQSDSSLDT